MAEKKTPEQDAPEKKAAPKNNRFQNAKNYYES